MRFFRGVEVAKAVGVSWGGMEKSSSSLASALLWESGIGVGWENTSLGEGWLLQRYNRSCPHKRSRSTAVSSDVVSTYGHSARRLRDASLLSALMYLTRFVGGFFTGDWNQDNFPGLRSRNEELVFRESGVLSWLEPGDGSCDSVCPVAQGGGSRPTLTFAKLSGERGGRKQSGNITGEPCRTLYVAPVALSASSSYSKRGLGVRASWGFRDDAKIRRRAVRGLRGGSDPS